MEQMLEEGKDETRVSELVTPSLCNLDFDV